MFYRWLSALLLAACVFLPLPNWAAAANKKADKEATSDEEESDTKETRDKGLVIKGGKHTVKLERKDGKEKDGDKPRVISGDLIHLNSRGVRMKIRGRTGLVRVQYKPSQIAWVEVDGKRYTWDKQQESFVASEAPPAGNP